jgi:hypothetical protein
MRFQAFSRRAHRQSESEIARQLFPDQETFRRDENRRWELTTNHWDLAIHRVDPISTE